MRLRVLLIAVVFALTACGSRGQIDNMPVPATGTTGSAADAFPRLPAPSSALQKARQTSALILHEGSGYVQSLPNSNVTVDGSTAIYSPNWGGGASGITETAYAIYSFNLDGEANRILRLQDGATDVEPDDVWVGLADFEKDAWDWQSGEEFKPLQFDIGSHLSENSDVLVVLLFTGHQKFRLNAATFISTDETEDNDTQGSGFEANGWNFRGLTGSLGNSETHSGEDGDFVDWWRLNATYPATPESSTEIVVEAVPFLGEGFSFTSLTVYNSSGTEIAGSSSTFAMFSPGDEGFTSQADLPLFVKVELTPPTDGNYAEYEFSSALYCPPTAEWTISATQGDLPLTVDFDASASTGSAESPISYYAWYFTYDPSDSPAQPDYVTFSPMTSFTFTELGFYRVFVEVVTESGNSRAAYGSINAGDIPYDEREYNDYYDSANVLPSASGSGWTGHLGIDPVTPAPFHGWDGGYAGSSPDCMGFEIQPGEAIRYSVEKLDGEGDFALEIHGSEDSGFDQSNPRYEGMDWRQYFRDSMFFSTAYMPSLSIETIDDSYGNYEVTWFVGKPPYGQSLTPDMGSGSAPLTVTFTPGAMDDDGVIDHYVWDTDHDGVADQTSTGPIQLTFDTPGNYRVGCFPIDDDGFSTYFQGFTDITVN